MRFSSEEVENFTLSKMSKNTPRKSEQLQLLVAENFYRIASVWGTIFPLYFNDLVATLKSG